MEMGIPELLKSMESGPCLIKVIDYTLYDYKQENILDYY